MFILCLFGCEGQTNIDIEMDKQMQARANEWFSHSEIRGIMLCRPYNYFQAEKKCDIVVKDSNGDVTHFKKLICDNNIPGCYIL